MKKNTENMFNEMLNKTVLRPSIQPSSGSFDRPFASVPNNSPLLGGRGAGPREWCGLAWGLGCYNCHYCHQVTPLTEVETNTNSVLLTRGMSRCRLVDLHDALACQDGWLLGMLAFSSRWPVRKLVPRRVGFSAGRPVVSLARDARASDLALGVNAHGQFRAPRAAEAFTI